MYICIYRDMVTGDVFTDIAHTPDQKKDLCPRRGKSRRWSGYGETFTDHLVNMGDVVKNVSYGEKFKVWWKMVVMLKNGSYGEKWELW